MTATFLLSDIVQDTNMQKHILRLAENEDDPPVVFHWNYDGLSKFWNKAVAYGAAGGAVPPPPQINGGNQLVGAPTSVQLDQLKVWILDFLRNQINPPPAIQGADVALACTQNQFGIAGVQLGLMMLNPWFVAVLAHGPPLTTTFGGVYHPRARVASGLLDHLPVGTPLWD